MTLNNKHNITISPFLLIIIVAFFVRFFFLSLSVTQIGLDGIATATHDTINYLKMSAWLSGTSEIYPEASFFDWGIGYAGFLSIIKLIFGQSLWWILIIQITMSAFTCGLVYKISKHLFESNLTGYIAAFLIIFSETSINLSILILSETVFVFLLTLGLYLFLSGLKSQQKYIFILSGLLIGISILTRSVAQFFPLILGIYTISFLLFKTDRQALKEKLKSGMPLIKKVMIAITIIVAISCGWMTRNYILYDEFVLTFVTSTGPVKNAVNTMTAINGPSEIDLIPMWLDEYKQANNKTELSLGEIYDVYKSKSWEVFKNHPYQYIKTYLTTNWENMHQVNYLHRISLPGFNYKTIPYEEFVKRNYINYFNFILCVISLVVLSLRRKYYPAIILGVYYSYFALLLGVTQWQGSRIFYPGQIAAVILIAFVLNLLYEYTTNLIKTKTT